ncbi:hypothetical protein K439DRAFT_725224 [Ramaria rubella]|nr:hypothetical protein K439DRAFT_725224 [Ramaria rubella]
MGRNSLINAFLSMRSPVLTAGCPMVANSYRNMGKWKLFQDICKSGRLSVSLQAPIEHWAVALCRVNQRSVI